MLSPPLAHPQLLANAVIFLCGNLTGAFHKHHMQDASRELFTYTVKCIQIRRKLRIEKRQQVRSLPSLGATAWPSQAPRPTSFLSAHHTLTEQHVHGAHGWTPMPASHHRGRRGHGRPCAWLGWWQGAGQQSWRVPWAAQVGT